VGSRFATAVRLRSGLAFSWTAVARKPRVVCATQRWYGRLPGSPRFVRGLSRLRRAGLEGRCWRGATVRLPMGVAAAGGGGGGSAGLEEVLGSFRGTAEGWLRLAHRQAQQRVRSGCCATPGTNHDAAETMLSGRRVGVVRIVYWVCEAHGSGTAWWCRVGCAVQCSAVCSVLCSACSAAFPSWVVLILRRVSEWLGNVRARSSGEWRGEESLLQWEERSWRRW
jgi:hypothetical protein